MSTESQTDPQLLVDAIRGPSPRYKREAVDAIIAQQAQTTPLLLALVDEILQDPEDYLDDAGEEDFDLLYGLMLLTHFRETAAHDLVVRLARLPTQTLDPLLSDLITEVLGTMLLATSGGRTDGFRAIVQDRAADPYARSQAADALAFAVHLGHADRKETLELLAGLLNEEESDEPDSYFWTGIGDAMLKLHPTEYADALYRAWDEELIDAIVYDDEDIEAKLGRTEEEVAAELEQEIQRLTEKNIHDRMSWWACFHDGQLPPGWADSSRQARYAAAEQAQKEGARKKKDENKKARKKQRAARKKQGKKRR